MLRRGKGGIRGRKKWKKKGKKREEPVWKKNEKGKKWVLNM